ncbi:MAG: phosphoglycerate kinase [Pseudohongiellaceae bacterium]|jgi:phosphoglycerate kinase
MSFTRIDQLNLKGKRVLIREDLNVPISEGKIVNDARIQAALPTIRLVLELGGQPILMSHLGRPSEGVAIEDQPEFSLAPVAAYLQALLAMPVTLVSTYLDGQASFPEWGQIYLLENVRANVGEAENTDTLAKQYAALADVFIMDAFGTAHRAQASTHGVAKYAKEVCAGPLLASELDALGKSLESPKRPMLAIVGGAKVSSKLAVLQSLAAKVDQLIVGGGIANTFLVAAGFNVGKSLHEPELVDVAKRLLATTNIPLPIDVVCATQFSNDTEATTKLVSEVGDDDMILDIGPKSIQVLADLIGSMQTIIWNGPVGVFEFEKFANGTRAIAQAVAANQGFSIAGGGETVTAIDQFGVTDAISYISTGGGAFLEYVQGDELPAVQILLERGANR